MSEDPTNGSAGDVSDQPSAPEEMTAAEKAAKKARLDAAVRRYHATLRNEAESGSGGFSAEYYRSQKPPHWG